MKQIMLVILATIVCLSFIGCGSSEGIQITASTYENHITNTDFIINVNHDSHFTHISINVSDEIVDDEYEGEYTHTFTISGEDMSQYQNGNIPDYVSYDLPSNLTPGEQFMMTYKLELFDTKRVTYSKEVSGYITIAYEPEWETPESPSSVSEDVTFAWTLERDNLVQIATAFSYGWIDDNYDGLADSYEYDEFERDLSRGLREFTFPANCLKSFDNSFPHSYFAYEINSLNYYLNDELAIICGYTRYVYSIYDKEISRELERDRVSKIVEVLRNRENL